MENEDDREELQQLRGRVGYLEDAVQLLAAGVLVDRVDTATAILQDWGGDLDDLLREAVGCDDPETTA